MKRHAPATARNREPILDVLRRVLPAAAPASEGPPPLVLEIASGSGEHAVYMATALPNVRWLPTDVSEPALQSIEAWAAESALPNLLPPLRLDARQEPWPAAADAPVAAVVCINMIHIAPWAACLGLLRGAAQRLGRDGILFLYGPFKRGGAHTAPSNESFDRGLREQDPSWGVRDLDDVTAAAREAGLELAEVVLMPANNLSVIYKPAGSAP